ncbi:MAG: penicillin-binding protein [Sphingomonas bacterium]|uniref:penicillin-binding protein 1A n=1 Tax=Sphingomonas bacterium TaxID=1895847 RepID=UPI00261FC41D|nr:transglycosylase domain-containing protein [Sphingomonas bacterium]MDB5694707.1 penicillin-binding protein [Sphingomonas bacterium]
MAYAFSLPAPVRSFAQRPWVRRLGKLGAWGFLLLGLAILAGWLLFARDLPSVEKLRAYEPPLPTNIRGGDGTPIQSYARERRVELAFAEYPKPLINAFLAAEDKTFFEHGGVDYLGILSAFVTNMRSDGRPIGASTITQQVAKNLLLSNEVSYVRKVREAILAYRIEATLSKQQILELYLNQIALGRNAFGVEAASHAYFDKSLVDLSLAQMAYLAILPKGPSNYDPVRHPQRAIERRNWVLGAMQENEFITAAQYQAARAEPLGTQPRQPPKNERAGSYFTEEVRRLLIGRYGETDRDGPFSVYAGGLWVRTSFDGRLQDLTQQALRDGMTRYERGRGWSGPIKELKPGSNWETGGWLQALLNTNIALDYNDWRAAVVISRVGNSAEIGFTTGVKGTLPAGNAQMPRRGVGGTAFAALKPGDVIAVAPAGRAFALRSVPRVSGGFVVEEPATGRVLAMQGGFDARIQSFNRATQALRQPGSTIKPIVYASALENGMTPASIIVDGPFCVYQGANLGNKCFRNFNNQGGAGPKTMRWGLEQSRNLMTVRTAATIGIGRVTNTIKRMGVGDYPPYLSFSLGAGDTTVLRMVNAFATLANQGRAHEPSLIDFVQDRHGKVIWPANWRACDGCNAPDWNGQPMPRPSPRTRQVIDPITAFQMVHITEGVIQRGTATVLRDLNRPIFGKTGTTTGPNDVWFIGGTPQFVGGLYIGYDQPRPLGGVQGGTFAAPIFKQFAVKAYEGMEVMPFRAPAGVRMVRIDRMSGQPVFGGWPSADPKSGVIWEAFKPESEPRRASRRSEAASATPSKTAPTPAPGRRRAAPTSSDTLQKQEGIY